MNEHRVHVELGEQQMLRCPVCGSLEPDGQRYCYHSEQQLYGTVRLPVRVTVENIR